MERDLDLGLAGQQWVVLSYALSLSALYLVSGAVGDRYGRRESFVVGVVAFVFDIVVSDPAGVVAGLVLGVLIVVLWIVAPIVIRVRGLRGDRR